ncbi:MAG: DUF1858 domain-containing protein [Bacteroidales bacterium]
MPRADINVDTRIARLLDDYPELEHPLMEIAPEFKKLKNPVLRKTIARVTSLKQAAAIAGIPASDLVSRLRVIAGLPALELDENHQQDYMGPHPQWLQQQPVHQQYDASQVIRSGNMPLSQIMNDLEKLPSGQLYLLVTPLLPAPLLDKVRQSGYLTWTEKQAEERYVSHILRGD